jgi:hypothetical protein
MIDSPFLSLSVVRTLGEGRGKQRFNGVLNDFPTYSPFSTLVFPNSLVSDAHTQHLFLFGTISLPISL